MSEFLPSRGQNLARTAILTAELGLLLFLVRAFSIENANFFRVFLLATIGFPVHALLPRHLKLPFFVVLSFAGVVLLFGAGPGAWLLGLGSMLLGLAHLPVPFRVRVTVLLAVVGALVAFRAEWWTAPWPSTIWPIFGAMFMFRLIVYLYDLKNRSAEFSLWRGLAYFFMLPNVCFPLFPVVDYKNFSRGHLSREESETHQRGIEMILRGLLQLILYRGVYQYLSVDPSSIDTATGAALYLVRPYLLYLKISGSFHAAVGLLHVFGFELPRTNHNYFLASSFTDYWRRINIYWKEFLQKIFFNPVYFRFARHMSPTKALVLATIVAFFATWALHSYQWFWIRNSFPVIWQDIVFWSVMGVVVLANMLHEQRHGRKRSLKKAARTWRGDIALAARTTGTFVAICSFWAVWSVGSFGELKLMAGLLLRPSLVDALWIVGGLVALGVAAVLYDRFDPPTRAGKAAPHFALGKMPVTFSVARIAAICVALVGLVYAQFVLYYPPVLADTLDQFRNPLRLSGRDAQMLDRGYYEDLTDVARFNPELAKLYADKPPDWDRCFAIHRTGRFPTHELLPSRNIAFKGSMMSTNQWGMRDRDYTREKPAGVRRILMAGASHVMGTGVADDEVVDAVLESRLNAEAAQNGGPAWEILNLAVGGYGPLSRLWDLENRALEFHPDVFVTVGIQDLHWAAKEALMAVQGELALPWSEPVELVRSAGIDVGTDALVADAKLRPYREDLLAWIYARMVEVCHEHEILPVALFIPQPRSESVENQALIERQVQIAREQGMVVIEAFDAYAHRDSYDDLWIASWDRHPNAEGHRLLADAIHPRLRRALES